MGHPSRALRPWRPLLRRLAFINDAPVRNWLAALPDDGAGPSGRSRCRCDRRRSAVIRHRVPPRFGVAVVVIAIGIVVASSVIAGEGNVPEWEATGLRIVNSWPDWLEPIMWVLQQIGVVMAPVFVGLAVAWRTRDWRHAVAFVLVLPLKLGVEKGIVKQLVERERPFVSVGPHVEVRGPAFEGLSFPSGHTTTAFAIAVLIAAFLPRKWWPIPIAWAAVVGISRLYYGEHNVLDVIAGAAIGTAFAMVLWLVVINPLADSPRR